MTEMMGEKLQSLYLKSSKIKMEEELKGPINVFSDLEFLNRQLKTGESLIVGLRSMTIAEIRHTPKFPVGRWDRLKRRLGLKRV